MMDHYNREIDYLRISITDRCNLRCIYCIPKEGICYTQYDKILTYDEILQVCKAAVVCGIRKIKITGGEPLVRKDVAKLIGKIASLKGIEEVTMTTNGIFLEEMLPELMENNLSAVNISLDTLDSMLYKEITGLDALTKVKNGIAACIRAGIKTKVNVVLSKKLFRESTQCLFENGRQILQLSQKYPVDVRFIEIMPIGLGKDYETTAGSELLNYLKQFYVKITADTTKHGNGPAVYYKIPGFQGSLGLISAIHGKFCNSCNRIRMTCTGEIKPCLCYNTGFDLRGILRDETLTPFEKEIKLFEMLQKAIVSKSKAHCFEMPEEISESKKMVMIGG